MMARWQIGRRGLLLGFAGVCVSWRTGFAVADSGVAEFIRELSNSAITDLQFGPEATDKDRAVKLKPFLEQYFDMPGIAKYMLGSYWRRATPQEQADFTVALTDFLSLAYAKRFATYNGHELTVGRVRDEGDGRSTVFTKVKLPNGEPARVEWVVLTATPPLRISDVRVEGLSLAETHRQEFASLISNNGGQVAALIDALKKKTGM
jgi:phospholipid transport system substrate-binding protein